MVSVNDSNCTAAPESAPPYSSQPIISDKDRGIITLFLLAGPLPFLYSINSVLSFWSLDSFHYILFQVVVFAMYPSLTRKKVTDPKLITSDKNSQPIQKNDTILRNPHLSISNDLCNSSTFSEATLRPDSPLQPENFPSHRFSEECGPLFDNLQEILSVEIKEDTNNWEIILETFDPMPISIYRDKNYDHRYRLDCTFDNSPAAVFDSLSLKGDSEANSATSKILKEHETLEVLDSSSSILYFMSISVWPTSARDVCMLQSSQVLSDGSIISVLKSVTHESKLDSSSGAVRMDVHLAGRWFRPVAGNPKLCKVMGYFHGDPKGWIPRSVVNLASTKFIPRLLLNINTNAAQLPVKELPQSIPNRFTNVGSSLVGSSGSTICDDDVSDNLSASELKLVHLEPMVVKVELSTPPNKNYIMSHKLEHTPTFWERLQVNLSFPWSSRQVIATAGPILLSAAIVAVVIKRNQS